MTHISGSSPPSGDLQKIRRQLESTNPELYRQLALYLQVLRQILPHSVDQACFHLATQVQPGRYTALSEPQRRRFHASVTALVSRCSTLLTVEQLACLAARIAREDAHRADRFLPDPHGSPDRLHPSRLDGAPSGPGSDHGGSPTPEGGLPTRFHTNGSVHLGLDLPIEGAWLGWGDRPGFGDADSAQDAASTDPEDLDALLPDLAEPELTETDEEVTASDLFGLFSALAAAAAGMDKGIRGLELPAEPGMAEFATQAAEDDEADEEQASPDDDGSSSAGEASTEAVFPFRFRGLGRDAAALGWPLPGHFGEDDPAALYRPPAGGGLLPRNPLALLAWLEGLEQALERQLRDLSHAVNRELMQCGLIRILLPLNLLDGVLKGQIEVQSTHPNLLQLALPTGQSGKALRAHAMLLRRADLELEQPRLRTVRSRLQQLREEGRRMAQLYHRLQRRIQAHEAEALWLQDIRSMRPGLVSPP
jgi:hypothetical protein